jgi:RNA polymerase sigma factor FliA
MYTAQGTLDKNMAIKQHTQMVRRVASQMIARLPSNVEMDDLVQVGMIGLMEAMSRFDVQQGIQFETFATQRVKGAMLDELRNTDWVPRSVRKNQRSIAKAIHTLQQRLKRAPNEAEIAAELGLPISEYQNMLNDTAGGQLMYLEDFEEALGERDLHPLENDFADMSNDPAESLKNSRFRKALANAIAELPEREKLVMSMYYEQDLNLKEVGSVLNVSESRVCQLHSQAVARLRAKLKGWQS